MAVSSTQSTENLAPPPPSQLQVPLIEAQDPNEARLLKSLSRLEAFLRFFGFCQFSVLSFTISWLSFLLLGIALPVLMIYFSSCTTCEKYEIDSFELEILVFQSLVAAISLLCISHNLRKYGVRKFLFVDRYHGHTSQNREEHIRKINGFFHLLTAWVLACLLLKTAREVVRVVFVHQDNWWKSVGVMMAWIVMWTYSTIIFLSGCGLFHLVCNLQVVQFENYGKLFERDLDVSVYIMEHIRLTHYLSKISHRFRLFFILELLAVTASQFVALIRTTGSRGIINLLNGGDFVISSIFELVGVVICLHAAAKITHRAQGVASVATRWHSLVTCNSGDACQTGMTNNGVDTESANPPVLLPVNYSETDLESVDYVPLPTTNQLASYMTSYHGRQAFVTYLQSNPGGFTVFGWKIDRTLINTIFFLEMSLVLFVLGKTITIT